MKLGFSPVSAAILDLDAAWRLAAELELDFVELSFDLFEAVPMLQPADQVRELTRTTGIGSTLHLSYVDLNLASVIPAARRTSVDRTLRGLEYAEAVGASCGVLHTGLNYIPFEQAVQLAGAALEQSLTELHGSVVPVALENLVLTPHDLVRDAAQLADLTARHGFANCLDVGHANIEAVAKGTETIPGYIAGMGQRLIHLHLHNNYGVDDDHLPTDEGTLDFTEILPLLSGFTGTACLEITTGADGVRQAVAHLRSLGLEKS